jgi:hypothetical protein
VPRKKRTSPPTSAVDVMKMGCRGRIAHRVRVHTKRSTIGSRTEPERHLAEHILFKAVVEALMTRSGSHSTAAMSKCMAAQVAERGVAGASRSGLRFMRLPTTCAALWCYSTPGNAHDCVMAETPSRQMAKSSSALRSPHGSFEKDLLG